MLAGRPGWRARTGPAQAASTRGAARTIAVSHPEARALFMSGYTDGEISHQGVLDAGASFLQKPFTTDSLARAVRSALDRAPGTGVPPASA